MDRTSVEIVQDALPIAYKICFAFAIILLVFALLLLPELGSP